MGRVDWGKRSERWAGVRSIVVNVGGVGASVLVHDAAQEAPADAPVQLLIPPMGLGAWSWLDAMAPLSAFGQVIAVDLPGSGGTRPLRATSASASAIAAFLRELASELALPRLVVHGHSMGGLVAALFADLVPDRVERLILVSPPLPGEIDPTFEGRVTQGLGRAALAVWSRTGGVVVQAGVRAKASAWPRSLGRLGANPTGISPDLKAVAAEEIKRIGARSWRASAAASAFTSVVAALTIDQRETRAAVDRIAVPTLLIWGDRDKVIPRLLIGQLAALRPDWDLRILEGVGHLPPWEAPAEYAAVVGEWLAARER